MAPQTFDLFIDMLRNVHGPNMLRVKGLLGIVSDRSRPVAIMAWQHVFDLVRPCASKSWPDGQELTRIVFILRDLDPAHVKGLWRRISRRAFGRRRRRRGPHEQPSQPEGRRSAVVEVARQAFETSCLPACLIPLRRPARPYSTPPFVRRL